MKRTLGRQVITGLGWTLGSAVSVRLMQLLVTIILARLLVPAEFGLFAIGTMLVTAIALFRDFGFGQALIFHKTDVQRNAETTLVMSTVFGVVAWGAMYAMAPLIAAVFENRQLIWPLRAMSFSVVISSLATVPSLLLERDLEFRKRAMPEFVAGLSYAAVSIVLALRGFGVWSLVAGHLASNAASAVVTWHVARWAPAVSFHRDSAKKTLSFGKPLMAASVLFLAFYYIDQAAIGKWLGVTALGYYNLAFTICSLPATNITHVVNRVMYPTYSMLNDDIRALRDAYTRTVKSISILSFPIAIWFYVASPDFVVGFFGEKWLPAIPLFRVLAFYGMFRSIGATAGSVFMALGEPKWVYRLNSLQLLIAAPLVYPVAINYGTFGVAMLFTLAYTTGTSLALWKVVRLLDMTVLEYTRMFRGPIITSVIAVLGSFFIANHFLPSRSMVAIGSAGLAGIVYIFLVLKFDGDTYRAARAILKPIDPKVYGAVAQGKAIE